MSNELMQLLAGREKELEKFLATDEIATPLKELLKRCLLEIHRRETPIGQCLYKLVNEIRTRDSKAYLKVDISTAEKAILMMVANKIVNLANEEHQAMLDLEKLMEGTTDHGAQSGENPIP